jgi:hypothetical protein
MNIRKILFATTNENKINRIKKLIDDPNIELITLNDLDFTIEEPEELGADVLEIAKNKANYYWEKIEGKYPVLAQDDGMDFLGNVAPEEDPGASIKAPVVREYGEFNVANAIAYYSKLADKYGGEIDFVFRYGHGYVDGNGLKGASSKLEAKLSKDPKGIEQVGKYPLRALTKFKIGDIYVYSIDASEEEKVQADNDLRRALLELL